MKYPITPDYLTNAPEKLVGLYQQLEEDVIEAICEQLKTGGANETTLERIRLLQRRGLSLKKIEKRIRKLTSLSKRELNAVYGGAIERNRAYFNGVLDKLGLVFDKKRRAALQAEIEAIQRQTDGTFENITQTLGFAIRGPGGKVSFKPIADAYQAALNKASVSVWAGANDYNSAIRVAIRELTDSGLQTIDYETGWHNRVDVAARRAVMTGIAQISAKYSDALMEEIGTEYVEVTAHRGARDKGVGPMNHKSWQGKVFRWNK